MYKKIKNIVLVGFVGFVCSLDAQSTSAFTKLAKKEYENKNYVDASLFAIKALRIKAKNKKAQEILSLAYEPAVNKLQEEIKFLEERYIEFEGDITVIKRTEVLKSYVKLKELDRGALEISRTVSSKKYNLNFKKFAYRDGMMASKELLLVAKQKAAEMHYVESKALMALNDRASSKKAAKKLKQAYNYVADYKDAKELYEKARVNGSTHLLILSLENNSGVPNFGNIETLMSKLLYERVLLDPSLMEFLILENAASVKRKAKENGVILGDFSLEWLKENAGNIGIDAVFMGELTYINEKIYADRHDKPVQKKKNVDSGKDRKYQDSNGKWQTESIWVDVYATVYAHHKKTDVSTSVNFKYIDFDYDKKEIGTVNGMYKWRTDWVTYTGDERAAKTHYLFKSPKYSYPTREFFANELAIDASKKILNNIEYLLR